MDFTPLTPQQRHDFERDGILIVRDALPAQMVERLSPTGSATSANRAAAPSPARRGTQPLRAHTQVRVLRLRLPLAATDGLLTMPEEVLERCDPIRRQPLGSGTSVMGYQLPEDDDVPLKAWLQVHTGVEIDRRDEIPTLKVSQGR